ncbi:SDR family oxidoreductase [Niveispirillum fermenti]|uniref:SDR family oxidoreductase n=1 Tax=Niveispirillum fermenti TaxID=1233113 RepID=UPI003A85A734
MQTRSQAFGLTDAELATRSTVYRDDALLGQVILVTGGAGGFGRAMAILFTRLGADVVIAGRDGDRLAAAAASVGNLTGRTPFHHPVNIRQPDSVDALYDAVQARHGRIDTLVNNAGGQFAQNAIDFSRKGWLAVIDTNLNGTWWMMQGAAQRWRDQARPGNIINIVVPIARGIPQTAHTTAARAGIVYLSKTVSTEWAPLGIRVNCVAPGTIESDGFQHYDPVAVARFRNANPLKMLGDVWDVAEGCAYLAAPSAKFITGEVLTIDGGMQQWGTAWSAGRPDYFKEGE